MQDVYDNKDEGDEVMDDIAKKLNFSNKHMMKIIYMSYLYHNIVIIYNKQMNYSKVLKFYEKSLTIKQNHLLSNHRNIDTSHTKIGVIHYSFNYYAIDMEHYNQ